MNVFKAVASGQSVGPAESSPTYPIFPDDRHEHLWKISRPGLPEWTVAWTYLSRARIVANPKIVVEDSSLLKSFRSAYTSPEPLMESTRVQKGAIVWLKPDLSDRESHYPEMWLKARYSILECDLSDPISYICMNMRV